MWVGLLVLPLILGGWGIVARTRALSVTMIVASAILWGGTLWLLMTSVKPVTWTFFELAGVNWQIGWQASPIAKWMALLTTLINLLAQGYAQGYLAGNPRQGYFQSVMLAFTGAMLITVFGNNLLTEFVGWEWMGVGSYLLVGFFRESSTARLAASKAMLITRLGDVAFLLAVVAASLGHLNTIAAVNRQGGPLIAWALLIAVAFKSAQGPNASWLLDAMAGPTPASALIHAATMVAAGPYLLIRYAPLLGHVSGILPALAVMGGGTALLAGVGALGATEIKRVLAFSTVSQLGMMLLALGWGSPQTAWTLLVAHAIYKALLFFVGGIASRRAHSGHMTDLAGQLTVFEQFGLLVVGLLAVAGLPPTGGFVAKADLLHVSGGSWAGTFVDWGLSFLGGAYATRLLKALKGFRPTGETPFAMLWPPTVLSGLAVGTYFWHPWVTLPPLLWEKTWPGLVAVLFGAGLGALWTRPMTLCSGAGWRYLWQLGNVAADMLLAAEQGVSQALGFGVGIFRWLSRLVHRGGSGRSQRYVLLSGLGVILWVLLVGHV